MAVVGNRLGDIGFSIQNYVEQFGYGVVREMVGHGLGRSLHEDPQVPNYGRKGSGIKLKDGLVLAIEPMINLGTERVEQLADGWTIVTADRQFSAHFQEENIYYISIDIIINGREIFEKQLLDYVKSN